MKNIFLFIVSISLFSFSSTCSNNYGIKKIWLFSQTQYAGTVARDENGKQLTKGSWQTHFLYVEISKENKVTWDSISYQNKMYQISLTKIKKDNIQVGKARENKAIITIKPKSSRTLVEIQILNMDISLDETEYQFTLLGTRDNKKIVYKFSKQNINLLPELRP